MIKKYINMKSVIWFFILAVCTSGALSAQGSPVNSKRGIANYGFDLTTYWDGSPVKGSSEYTFEHKGYTYYFRNEGNKERFASSPEQYLPEYGGYCAYAMARTGVKVSVNPLTYEIRDNRLLLFYKIGRNNNLEKWGEEGPDELLQQADRNWKKITGTE